MVVITFFSNSYSQESQTEIQSQPEFQNQSELQNQIESQLQSEGQVSDQNQTQTDSEVTAYVVTAQKTQTTEFQSPSNISVITEEEIFASGKNSLIELLQSISNVQVSEGIYGKSSTIIRMRSSAGDNPFSQVLILYNGQKLNSPDMTAPNLLNIPLSKIKKIEIIDGGDSAQFGSNAIGGIINITTKTEEDGFSIDATIEYGSYNAINSELAIGYGTKKYNINLFGNYTHTDGYREHNKTNYWTTNLNSAFYPTDKITFSPYINYFGNTFELPGNLTYEEFEANPKQANAQAISANDKGEIWNINPGYNSSFIFTDNLQLDFPISYFYWNRQFDNYGYNTYFYHQLQSKPLLSFNPSLSYGKLNSNLGFDFSYVNYNGQSFSDIERTQMFNSYTINQFEYSPFINVAYTFPFNLSLNASTRYTIAPINAIKEVTNLDDSDTYKSFDYSGSISYTYSDLLTVYTKYATLYRLPFVDEKTMLTCFSGYHYSVFNKDLKPESGYNFETGIKLNLKKIFTFNALFFYMQMQNEIGYSSSLYTNVNMDPTKRIGCNFELSLKPIDFISFKLNFSYTNGTFLSGDYTGKQIPLNAALNGYSQLEFSLPWGIFINVDCTYTGKRYCSGDFLNEGNILPQLFLLGMSVRYTPKQLDNSLTIKASVTNLLDMSYPAFASYYHDSYYDYTSYSYYSADGRKINFSVVYKY